MYLRLMRRTLSPTSLFMVMLFAGDQVWAEFRVRPYVQNPAVDAMTVRWFTSTADPGELIVGAGVTERRFTSRPEQTATLAYNPWKIEPGEPQMGLPYRHSIRVSGLEAGQTYEYVVQQGEDTFRNRFTTTPGIEQPVRFVVYSDSETEPESSTTPPVEWPAPAGSNRPAEITRYVVNQTFGYIENLKVMAAAHPHFIMIAGDLVESGGEQRDWDEFWKHAAGEYGNLASSTPILPALGNHENYAGPGGGYSAEGADFATAKYLTYFDVPSNAAMKPEHHGRYYRIDYGPISLITVDSSDGLPHKTASDTNHSLEGSHAPDFNPGSEQYRWLEQQLADAQRRSRFTFVQFHHTQYGSGPHSIPFGQTGFSGQSGIAMRILQPLLFRYGVDVVFSGHDELLERSATTGTEIGLDGQPRPHTLQCYDVGIGGDGLRGPVTGFDNPVRKFLAHDDAPEIWDGKRLVSGGKHYGHLDVSVAPDAAGEWTTTITPVHVFPLMDAEGRVTGWQRRPYADIVTLKASTSTKLQGAWSDGDQQRTLRNVHLLGAATLLGNGQVIAAGGLNRTAQALNADTVAELYDPATQTWTVTGSLKIPRWSLDAITLRNGRALFAGGSKGFTADGALDTAEVFDPETGQFTFTANSLSVARHSSGISMLKDGKVLITGGSNVGNNLGGTGVTAVDIYDPEKNAFQAAAPLHAGRALHAQVTLRDGRVLVIGGAQTNAEIYDPIRNVWTMSAGKLPSTLKDMKAFELFDGRVFLPGGQNTVDGLTTDATWFFDSSTTLFSPGPSLAGFNAAPSGVQIGCSDYSAFDLFPAEHSLHGRYILIAGGEHDPLTGPDVELNSAIMFDAARNKLINMGPMPYVHDDHTESMLSLNRDGNPEILLFGGNSSRGTSRFQLRMTTITAR